MKTILFGEVLQRRTIDPGQHFDLSLGFVGPDSRSVKNISEILPISEQCWVFTGPDCSVESAATRADILKIKANIKKLGNCQARAWNEQSASDLARLLGETRPDVGERTEYRILLDVSAFPRTMLASLLNVIRETVIEGLRVRLTLTYRLALFTKPRDVDARPNHRVAPVHRSVAGWPRLPGLPVHLIVGLGYERGKALGAVEYIQPAHLSLFSPMSPEPKFADQVRERNRELLDGTAPEELYYYEVLEPAAQFAQLSSMLSSMLMDSKPVLLPFGPKIFFAVCVLLSFSYSEVAVWHVSGEEEETAAPVKPSEHAVYVDFSLRNDSDMGDDSHEQP